MSTTKRFMEGATGAVIGTLVYQLVTHPILTGAFNWQMTVLFALVAGTVYGGAYVLMHLRRNVTLLTCLSCGGITVAAVFGPLLMYTGAHQIENDAAPLLVVGAAALALCMSVGAYALCGKK